MNLKSNPIQSKPSQFKPTQDKTRQDKTAQDNTKQDNTKQDKARQHKARLDNTRQAQTRIPTASTDINYTCTESSYTPPALCLRVRHNVRQNLVPQFVIGSFVRHKVLSDILQRGRGRGEGKEYPRGGQGQRVGRWRRGVGTGRRGGVGEGGGG